MPGPSTDNALADYPRRVQGLEAQFAGFAGQLTAFGGRFAALEGRIDRVEARLERVEARLDRVEARLDRVEQILERVVVDLAELRGKVSQLPTTWQLVTWITGLNTGLALGIAGLVYAVARTAMR